MDGQGKVKERFWKAYTEKKKIGTEKWKICWRLLLAWWCTAPRKLFWHSFFLFFFFFLVLFFYELGTVDDGKEATESLRLDLCSRRERVGIFQVRFFPPAWLFWRNGGRRGWEVGRWKVINLTMGTNSFQIFFLCFRCASVEFLNFFLFHVVHWLNFTWELLI